MKNNRLLFVDTTRSGLLDSLDNYFCNSDGMVFGVPTVTPETTFFPNQINHLDYESNYNTAVGNFTLTNSYVALRFDFSTTHPEDIIIHEQCGGGNASFDALKRLTLLPQIAHEIEKTINELGDYDSIHIRNTDYKTDYKKFFSELEIASDRKIVLCSDDFECQEHAKSVFSDRIVIPNQAPQTNGAPLHYNKALDRRSTNIAAIADLLILASGKKLHYTEVTKGILSGFTKLAKNLHANPQVVQKLLGKQA